LENRAGHAGDLAAAFDKLKLCAVRAWPGQAIGANSFRLEGLAAVKRDVRVCRAPKGMAA